MAVARYEVSIAMDALDGLLALYPAKPARRGLAYLPCACRAGKVPAAE